MDRFKKFVIKVVQTPNYTLSPIEVKEYVDFEVERVYYLMEAAAGGKTGAHCHKVEKELFIVLKGTCTAVIDEGDGLKEISLKAQDAIYLSNYVWHHFKDLTPDTMMLALSSTNYVPDRSDYIEDYEQFKQTLANQ